MCNKSRELIRDSTPKDLTKITAQKVRSIERVSEGERGKGGGSLTRARQPVRAPPMAGQSDRREVKNCAK